MTPEFGVGLGSSAHGGAGGRGFPNPGRKIRATPQPQPLPRPIPSQQKIGAACAFAPQLQKSHKEGPAAGGTAPARGPRGCGLIRPPAVLSRSPRAPGLAHVGVHTSRTEPYLGARCRTRLFYSSLHNPLRLNPVFNAAWKGALNGCAA